MENRSHVPIAITGLGMVTALGPDVVTSCAAARAGLSRASELKVLPFSQYKTWGEEPVVGHVARFIGEGFSGIGKAFTLGLHALHDLLARVDLSGGRRDRTGLAVNFSDHYYFESQGGSGPWPQTNGAEDHRAEEWHGLIDRLADRCNLDLAASDRQLYRGGHAGLAVVLRDATEALRSGSLDRCLVGGIDSRVEPRSLEASAAAGVLKTADRPSGFIPGEAAAFLMLERLEGVASRQTTVEALVESVAVAHDPSDRLAEDPPRGVGLAQAIQGALAPLDLAENPVQLVVGDLNGDTYRSADWGHALARMPGSSDLRNAPLWVPALAFGDVGAATGAVSACLVARGFARGYAPSQRALVWLASDSGARGAFCLRRYVS